MNAQAGNAQWDISMPLREVQYEGNANKIGLSAGIYAQIAVTDLSTQT